MIVVIGAAAGLIAFGVMMIVFGLCQTSSNADAQLDYNEQLAADKHRAGWDEGWQSHFKDCWREN